MDREIKMPSARREKPLRKKPKDYSCCMLYDSNAAMVVLKGLSIATCNPSIEGTLNVKIAAKIDRLEQESAMKMVKKKEHVVSDKMACSYCFVEFAHRRDQREHYKSDWHRYNLKRKIQGAVPVTEDQFEIMEGNLSSISGSESDSADTDTGSDSTGGGKHKKPQLILSHLRQRRSSASSTDSESEDSGRNYAVGTRHAKVYFRNVAGEIISLYRCVLYHKKENPADHGELLSLVEETTQKLNWLVLMAAGGHFAGAVFNKDEAVTHKTFHRYVVRAKRGTAQGSWDSQGNAPKSAGATLRRYNEAALLQEVQDLMASWSDYIQKADIIFMRAPGFNKRLFFGGKNPAFKKDDPRIRMIPFQTRRPTYNELRRVREMLATVECYGHEADIEDFVPISPSRKFSAETGRLEIIPDNQTSPRNKKYKGKDKLGTSPLAANTEVNCTNNGKGDGPDITKTLLPDHVIPPAVVETPDTSETSDTELICITRTISTQELKEFDFTERHRKKKKKVKKKKTSEDLLKNQEKHSKFDEEKKHLRSSLYTACKTGDMDTLKTLLDSIHIQENSRDKHNDDDVCKLSESKCQFYCDSEELDCVSNSCVRTSNNVREQTDRTTEPDDSSTPVYNLTSCVMKSTTKMDKGVNYKNSNEDADDNSKLFDGSRGELSQSEKLPGIPNSSLLNEVIGDKDETLLHVAAKTTHRSVLWMLLDSGADPSVRDKSGRTPYTVAEDKEMRNEFRRFMAKYPSKYQYEKSQIPSPLTPEMEAERKQKDTEKRKVQRKAKTERLKEKKVEDAKRKLEEEEKRKFLSLSDREKRALAAEKRLLEQQKEKCDLDTLSVSRCWQCGADLFGKVPFEYYDFKFCTTKCLQQHRKNVSKV